MANLRSAIEDHEAPAALRQVVAHGQPGLASADHDRVHGRPFPTESQSKPLSIAAPSNLDEYGAEPDDK
jgi:hypothetical protein